MIEQVAAALYKIKPFNATIIMRSGLAGQLHRESSRVYACTTNIPIAPEGNRICFGHRSKQFYVHFASAISKLSPNHIAAIVAHEIGHVFALAKFPKLREGDAEEAADNEVLKNYGIVINYRGPKELQWIDDLDLARVARLTKNPAKQGHRPLWMRERSLRMWAGNRGYSFRSKRASSGTLYCTVGYPTPDGYDDTVTVRIADHAQAEGGGFSVEEGYRTGEADFSLDPSTKTTLRDVYRQIDALSKGEQQG